MRVHVHVHVYVYLCWGVYVCVCLQSLLECVDDEGGAPQPEEEEAEPADARSEAFAHRLFRVVHLG